MKLILLTMTIFFISCAEKRNKVSNAHNSDISTLRWSESNLPIKIRVPVEYETIDEIRIPIENSIKTWNDASGKKLLEIEYLGVEIENRKKNGAYFIQPSDYTANDNYFMISLPDYWFLSFCSYRKGISMDYIPEITNKEDCESSSYSWNPSDLENGVLAITSWLYQGNDLLHADIVFNIENYSFSDDPGRSQFDLETTLVHEIGHFLGFIHVSGEEDEMSVMRTSIAPGAKIRNLSEGDVVRLKEKYGN